MMFGIVRTLAKTLVPRWLIDAVHARKHRRFETWEAACSAAASYRDDILNDFRISRAKLRPVDGSALSRTPLLSVVEKIGKTNLHIVDFGGATGELARDYLALHPGAKFTIVENPTMVSRMRGVIPGVEFSEAIPESCDIFFTSGTIQCLEKPYAVIRSGFTAAKHAAILTRNSFCEETIYRVQKSRLFHNGSGPIPSGFSDCKCSYPHQTINERIVQEIAIEAGFKLSGRYDENSGVLPYKGKVYGKDLVFILTSSLKA